MCQFLQSLHRTTSFNKQRSSRLLFSHPLSFEILHPMILRIKHELQSVGIFMSIVIIFAFLLLSAVLPLSTPLVVNLPVQPVIHKEPYPLRHQMPKIQPSKNVINPAFHLRNTPVIQSSTISMCFPNAARITPNRYRLGSHLLCK